MNVAAAFLAALPALSGVEGPVQAQPAPKDRVILKKGNPVEGIVQKDTWKDVVIQVGASNQTIRADDVQKIEYFDAPLAFRGAMAAIESEKWSEANSALGSAEQFVNDKETKPAQKPRGFPQGWFPAYLAFYRGLCQMQLGQYDNAIKHFEKVRKDFKDCRFLPQAFEYALQALRERKDTKGMEAIEKEIEQAPGELKTDLTARARRQRAELLYEENKYPEAKALFDQLRNSSDPDVAADATSGFIRCLQGLKDVAGIENFCKGIPATAPTPVLLIASNALGEVAFDKKDFVRAREHYVKSVVLYNPGRTGSGIEREHEKALYKLACCYEQLIEATKDAKAKEFWMAAASSAFREITIEYPTGRYREEASSKATKYEPKDKDDKK
jgi:tetratricopeptide (TPR) repeat protein